jgi:hypothetical protein
MFQTSGAASSGSYELLAVFDDMAVVLAQQNRVEQTAARTLVSEDGPELCIGAGRLASGTLEGKNKLYVWQPYRF